MTQRVTVTVDDKQLKKKIRTITKVYKPQALLKAIGQRNLSWIDENFRKDGRLVGGWKELSPNTVAGRRKASDRPLQDTGAMKNSFTSRVRGAREVVVGPGVFYAEFHEFGVPASKINPILPVRAKALSFMTTQGRVFRARVDGHPGIPKRRMLPNKIEGRQQAIEVINGILRKAQRKLAAGSRSR
jgi:phage gpG-like protein